ncbi:MAG: cytidine deaminase [Gemmatimonadaceae bacterium]|nr:cytidine deaminase [Gemmatimonadaceae bacterium]
MRAAYAPYSGFRVGAALLAEDGRIITGCNVENSAYPAGICAERGAIAAAVVQGVQRFRAVVIATEAEEPTSPCGICRQVLVEFAPNLHVISVTAGGERATHSLSALLPAPFTPSSLRHS